MLIKVKKLSQLAKLPTRATDGSAGWDLYACLSAPVVIDPGETKMIPLGLVFDFNKDWVVLVFARSGLASKHGIGLPHSVGVTDSDWRGENMLPLRNSSMKPYVVNHMDRIGQALIMPVPQVSWEEVAEVSETERGAGGFGSSGR